MKIGEYLKIGEKIKAARIKTGLSQREMAKRLGLKSSAYSNYENSYSEPSVEIMKDFCAEAGITLQELLELDIPGDSRKSIRTFADFLQDLWDLYKMGMPLSSQFHTENGELFGDFCFQSPQMATLASSLQKDIELYESGKLKKKQFEMRMKDSIQIFNVPIEEYIR